MEKLNNAKGAPPLYLQISEILRNKILTKEYAFDTIIPSETELQGMYQVSRITARQAIQELEKDGLVSRARGKGTIPSSFISSVKLRILVKNSSMCFW